MVVFDNTVVFFIADGVDPDGGSLTYSLGPGAPDGAFIGSDGVFFWIPTLDQAGMDYDITIIATDDDVPTQSVSETFTITVIINPAPAILSAVVNDGLIQRSRVSGLTVEFSEDVSASLASGDFVLENLTTLSFIDSADMALGYDLSTNTVQLTFPGLAEGRLPDGNYLLTVLSTGVQDFEGKTLDGDGLVTISDVNEVKGNYLAQLPPPPASLNGSGSGAGETEMVQPLVAIPETKVEPDNADSQAITNPMAQNAPEVSTRPTGRSEAAPRTAWSYSWIKNYSKMPTWSTIVRPGIELHGDLDEEKLIDW
jgi:hypothetical protein